eukprot:12404242-Ditylum_brightwellii.AAC.1
MEHRGACGGDGESGDSAGIMTQIPWKLFDKYRSETCLQPGAGMIFLHHDTKCHNGIKEMIKDVCKCNKLGFLGWREVLVNNDALSQLAKAVVPPMWQFFVKAPAHLCNNDEGRDEFERTLYLVRRCFEVERKMHGLVWNDDDDKVYIVSLASCTIVYKSMVQYCILPEFYLDLKGLEWAKEFLFNSVHPFL